MFILECKGSEFAINIQHSKRIIFTVRKPDYFNIHYFSLRFCFNNALRPVIIVTIKAVDCSQKMISSFCHAENSGDIFCTHQPKVDSNNGAMVPVIHAIAGTITPFIVFIDFICF
jgi:hypothetical protein